MSQAPFAVSVTWHPLDAVDAAFPNDGFTLLLAFDNGEVGPGYREAGQWFHFCGAPCMDVVTWWANYPLHPSQTLTNNKPLQTH